MCQFGPGSNLTVQAKQKLCNQSIQCPRKAYVIHEHPHQHLTTTLTSRSAYHTQVGKASCTNLAIQSRQHSTCWTGQLCCSSHTVGTGAAPTNLLSTATSNRLQRQTLKQLSRKCQLDSAKAQRMVQ